MRRWAIAALLLAVAAAAQAPPLTTVTQPTYDGNGTLTITAAQAFITANGVLVPQGQQTVVKVTAAGFTVALPPNIGSTPSGTYYIATYRITPGTTYSETWTVPTSSVAVGVAQVRVAVTPTPSYTVAYAQVLPPANCYANGGIPIVASNGNWTCVAPLVNPMTTEGDIIVGGASGAAERLAAGTAGYALTSNGPGAIPSWQPSSASSGVSSFNTRTGAVTLGTADVTALGTLANNTTGNAATATLADSVAAANITGSIANSQLANDAVTINASGPLAGGGSVALGATLSLSCPTCQTSAPPVSSVFGRTGAVVAASGDYNANQVTNAYDRTALASLTTLAAPGSAPASGLLDVWADSTDLDLEAQNSNAVKFQMVAPTTATPHEWLTSLSAGVLGKAQPSFADLSGSASDAQLADAYSGTGACAAHEWASTLTRAGAPTCTQPAYTDISGTPTLYYQTVDAAGTAQTQRGMLNFGSGLSVADNAGAGRTDVTVPAATTSAEGIVQLAGDLAGTATAPTVTNLSHVTNASLPVSGISATGTASSTTYLRGDGSWSTPSGGGGSTVGFWNPLGYGTEGTVSFTGPSAAANQIWLLQLEGPFASVKVSDMVLYISTADSTSGDYEDVGIYGPCALGATCSTLALDLGAQAFSTGYRQNVALAQGTVTLAPPPPGEYYFVATTANATTAQAYAAPAGSGIFLASVCAASTTTSTGGVLPASVAIPAATWSGSSTCANQVPEFAIHY